MLQVIVAALLVPKSRCKQSTISEEKTNYRRKFTENVAKLSPLWF